MITLASRTFAANVHFDSLPAGVNVSFSKASSPFMYLEGESLAQSTANADTFATPGDSARSFFRTSSNPASGISSAGFSSPASRFATYGGDVNLSVGFYWEDQPTALPAGSYDVFARAYPTSGGSYTFSLYTGTSLSEVNTTTLAASAASTSSGAPNWFKVGTVDLGSTTDTFRLQIGTTGSAVRFDTLMFTAVPEPTTLALIAVCGGALLRRRSRRVAG
jgi:hypothetical protein